MTMSISFEYPGFFEDGVGMVQIFKFARLWKLTRLQSKAMILHELSNEIFKN